MRFLSLARRSNMTVSGCVKALSCLFKSSNVGEPRESANYIVAHALNQKTVNSCQPLQKLSQSQYKLILSMVHMRMMKMPIQYILGQWDFSGIELVLKSPVFIPRPETEELVQLICNDKTIKHFHTFLEIGCGSGAISLALLSKMKHLTCTAIDASQEACLLTELNSNKLGLNNRIKVLNKYFQDYFSEPAEKKFDFVVSNPPYIPRNQLGDLQEEIIRYEDIRALDGGEDGFDIIKSILTLAPEIVVDNGLIWLEIDQSHQTVLIEFVREKKNIELISIFEDFMNNLAGAKALLIK